LARCARLLKIMDNAVELLNLILAESQPHQTIILSLREAEIIASLGERELGSALSQAILEMGIAAAMEKEGLFSRKVNISDGDAPFSVV
jgi:hypothetical protein